MMTEIPGWTTEHVMAALQRAGQPLTSHQLADRLAHGRATPAEWWHLAGVLERISYHPGATILRFYSRSGCWCYVHRDHAPAAQAVEGATPLISADDLRTAGQPEPTYHHGRIPPYPRAL